MTVSERIVTMKTTWNRGRKASWVIVSVGLAAVGVLATGVLAAGQAAPQGQATFTKDVAPILQRTCQNCHRPNGGLAPMALTTYEEARPWAKAIQQRTTLREMPPWFIEKNVGIKQFKNDISLSDAEIATIAAWVDAGAPQGNPADMPPPRQFRDTNAWEIGEPDLVVSSPVVTVKPTGGDWHAPYIGSAPTALTEYRWVAAVEIREYRPGETTRQGRAGGNNYLVLHHQSIGLRPGDQTVPADDDDETQAARSTAAAAQQQGFNYLYEVGQNATLYPNDIGVKLPAGATIHFNGTHLHSIGKEVKVQIQAGFRFHPKGFTPKYIQGLSQLRTPLSGWGAELDIPGNSDNVRYDKFYIVDKPTKVVTFEPHLHASGKRMCTEAIYPNGNIEMLSCAGYNHAWVKQYVYEDDAAPLLPTGTVLHVIAWYDNTGKNPRVVDPRNWKGLGHRSIDDMFILLSKFVSYTEDEFKAEGSAREARLRSSGSRTARGGN